MPSQLVEHPQASLALGHGLDLPTQAARVRGQWLAGRPGRPPVLLLVLLWARHCSDLGPILDRQLDALFADYRCTPQGWSEVQAARQVLAGLNAALYRQRWVQPGLAECYAGLLLIQDEDAQFLQAGAIGLLRYRHGTLQSLPGPDHLPLGRQAELALIQHRLPLSAGEVLLLAPQPLLAVADLQGFGEACRGLQAGHLQATLEPLLRAPGAAAILLPCMVPEGFAGPPADQWPAWTRPRSGDRVDGWRLLEACPYGPRQRLFHAQDEDGREALCWLAEQAADEAFWQREWALRRCSASSLPRVLSPWEPRHHAFTLLEPPAAGMRSLVDWAAARGPLDASSLMALLVPLIEAVRALQRRGLQGLWLHPRQVLVGEDGAVLLLPDQAALIPGVARQPLPADALPLAPELREGGRVDGRADQFALAALSYWLLCGQWPEVARRRASADCRYVPLAGFNPQLPVGWDGVLAKALAPRPEARFDALSELQQALEAPLTSARRPACPVLSGCLAAALALGVALLLGLWLRG
ncbi:MAG: protein kinase [Pseudomonas sp.]|uniref:protein kinase n=1 Tax=Pseudomonas sp. TaxID=306 RepID=UPI003398C0DE